METRNYYKILLVIFILLFPFSHSFASVVTLVDSLQVSNGHGKGTVRAGLTDASDKEVGGVQFNADGSKMFVRFFRDDTDGEEFSYIDEYDLSIPFDASSGTYAGDDERCELDHGESVHNPFDLHFSNDGMFFYFANRKLGGGATAKDLNFVARFDLTAPYDISTCSFSGRTTDLASNDNRNGSAAGASGAAENNSNLDKPCLH